MTTFTLNARRVQGSTIQIKLLLSLGEVVEMVPAVAHQAIRKSAPLCLTTEKGTFRFEGYPTGNIVNQEPAVQALLIKALGEDEEVEFDVQGSLALGKPAATTGKVVARLVKKVVV